MAASSPQAESGATAGATRSTHSRVASAMNNHQPASRSGASDSGPRQPACIRSNHGCASSASGHAAQPRSADGATP